MFDHGPRWIAPEKDLQFEYVTKLDEFVSDEDYDSSEEDDNSDREDDRRVNESTNENNKDGIGHLNPLQRAKLAHLLARLPTTNAKLRRGDVARVTAFAIKHAGEGADEVVEMIVSNVESPFAFASANPDWSSREADARPDKANDVQNDDTGDNVSKQSQKDKLDTSAAKLVGLYVISDILSSSSTSGVRHAWRYRQLFENAFKAHKTFEHLGRLEKELGWGRLKVEKWRRSIGVLLGLWEGWCVFPHQAHEQFVQSFEKPPLTEKEMEEERQRVEAEKGSAAFGSKGKSKWRTVDETASANTASENMDDAQPGNAMDMEAAGAPDEDLDGEPMSDIDGVPMEDSDMEDVDGKPLPDDSADENQSQPDPSAASQPLTEPVPESASKEPEHPRRRRRPKAEDMFADSDSDA
jgi:U2-associated protein SR140